MGALASGNPSTQAELHQLGATNALAAVLADIAAAISSNSTPGDGRPLQSTPESYGGGGARTGGEQNGVAEISGNGGSVEEERDGDGGGGGGGAEAGAGTVAERAVWAAVELSAGNADVQDGVRHIALSPRTTCYHVSCLAIRPYY